MSNNQTITAPRGAAPSRWPGLAARVLRKPARPADDERVSVRTSRARRTRQRHRRLQSPVAVHGHKDRSAEPAGIRPEADASTSTRGRDLNMEPTTAGLDTVRRLDGLGGPHKLGRDAGEVVDIGSTRHLWHTVWNPCDAPARILEMISPGGFELFFEELAAIERPANDSGRSGELGGRYGVESDYESVQLLCAEHGLASPVLGAN